MSFASKVTALTKMFIEFLGAPLRTTPTFCSSKGILSGKAHLLSAGIFVACFVSCGGGGGGGGGSTNSPATLGDIAWLESRDAPAFLDFTITDLESDPATILIEYRLNPNGAFEPLVVEPEDPDKVDSEGRFLTHPEGVEHRVLWDFDRDPNFDLDEAVDAQIRITLLDLQEGEGVPLSERTLDVIVGNGPPQIDFVTPPDEEESSGVVPLTFGVRDSTEDRVTIQAQFRLFGSEDGSWTPATSAGPLPEIETSSETVEAVFAWNVEADTTAVEGLAELRIRAFDGLVRGAWTKSPPFRLDNNSVPIAFVSEDFTGNSDVVGTVPISFVVQDNEEDWVDVFFQYHFDAQADFPELPSSVDELRHILETPRLRREYQIAEESEVRIATSGRVVSGNRKRLFVESLREELSFLVRDGGGGRTLELQRPKRWEEVSQGWSGAIPDVVQQQVLSTQSVLALIRVGNASWGLRELRTEDGAPQFSFVDVAEDEGIDLAIDARSSEAFIGAQSGGSWSVYRVSLDKSMGSPQTPTLVASDEGVLRALDVVDGQSLVALTDRGLMRIALEGDSDPVEPWLLGLSNVSDIASDGVRDKVYLATSDGGLEDQGDILALDLDSLDMHSVLRKDRNGEFGKVVQPQRLALFDSGRQLLVSTASNSAAVSIITLYGQLTGQITETWSGASSITSLSGSRDILVAVNDSEVWGWGGIRATWNIISIDAQVSQIELDAAIDERFGDELILNLADRSSRLKATQLGQFRRFLWEPGAAISTRNLRLRIGVFDQDLRLSASTRKRIEAPLVEEPGLIDGGALDLVIDDVDRNGVFDIARVDPVVTESRGRIDTVAGAIRPIRATRLAVASIRKPLQPDLLYPELVGNGAFFSGEEGLYIFTPDSEGAYDAENFLQLGSELFGDFACVDFNQDGLLDIAAVNLDQDRTYVYQQEEEGFPSLRLDPDFVLSDGQNNSWSALDAGLIDSDPTFDLAIAGAAGVSLFYGPFDSDRTSANKLLGTLKPEALIVDDFNNNGIGDLAVRFSDRLEVFLDPSTNPNAEIPSPDLTLSTPTGGRRLSSGDIDGDGDVDLVTHESDNAQDNLRTVLMFLNEGEGRFNSTPLERTVPCWEPAGSILVDDADGDGQDDVISGSQVLFGDEDSDENTPCIHLYTQLKSGERDGISLTLSESCGDGFSGTSFADELELVDLDGDGRRDLVFQSQACSEFPDPKTVVHFQTRTRDFQNDADREFFSGPKLLVDVNADGWRDLVLMGRDTFDGLFVGYDPTVLVYLNREGRFANDPDVSISIPLEAGDRPDSSGHGDFDGDAQQDLLVASSEQDRVLVGRQPPAGLESGTLLWTELRPYADAHVVDIDQDGDLDIAGPDQSRSTLGVFLNDGGFVAGRAGFDVELELPLLDDGGQFVDLDQDGILDWVTWSDSLLAGGVMLAFGPFLDGSAPIEFGTRSLETRATRVFPADLNGDGLLDLLMQLPTESGSAYRGIVQGPGRAFADAPFFFEWRRTDESDVELTDVLFDDVDGDGAPDYVFGASRLGSLPVTIELFFAR